MEENALKVMSEGQFVDQLLTMEHMFLAIGIYSILGLLQFMKPVKKFLFDGNYSWLVAPINVALSALGVWGLGLTTFTTFGMQVMVVLFLSMCVTFTHEAMVKHLISLFQTVMEKKLKP